MDDYKKDLIRNNVDLAARVIFAVNSFRDERNPFSKLKAASLALIPLEVV